MEIITSENTKMDSLMALGRSLMQTAWNKKAYGKKAALYLNNKGLTLVLNQEIKIINLNRRQRLHISD